MNYKHKLIEGAKDYGIDLSNRQVEQFITYMNILNEWNQKMNLTGLEEPEDIIIKHFLDSISCIDGMNLTGNEKIIDVGTGAGFPGLPLKIIYPDLELTLLDSLQKRIRFLEHVSTELGLDNVECIHGRAEDYGQDNSYREKYDYVVARAVASLEVLSEYTLPFVKVGGCFISQRGTNVKDEVIESTEAVETLGGRFEDIIEIDLPYSDAERHLVIISKLSKTPNKYPRRAGMPKKRPL
ncbi:16S rRNA (guanine(527)-N(7))-methyltransferase RsmG [Orenia marismortui]|uniref:Ribosomal RNA small subunit methyltransferase G n=1 Tax=Orenia marismortui TaxID=46469 RepID=A0A4R8H809_9FIRM|nr:16S rRNA (guanine(527)-N(7))-methyltransferase RsmG [Orenia marismortui]TDX51775.1 16S rRNA m(7)G-527 methyltransferase [Orenia marismortui]